MSTLATSRLGLAIVFSIYDDSHDTYGVRTSAQSTEDISITSPDTTAWGRVVQVFGLDQAFLVHPLA